eukprot:CAMPEP_0114232504 /NCGR_PEP_ID=MMETSP0058-20121206/4643_1 /TAXON_ID=36894 /ORGANISM="Pyramimonas parkeae, CCMP726" /LENGTH=140 /DNA_ID=CAMNT_0001343985 /DNA_START=200 /DNA_END=623 /DNA_ORIENTATION=-
MNRFMFWALAEMTWVSAVLVVLQMAEVVGSTTIKAGANFGAEIVACLLLAALLHITKVGAASPFRQRQMLAVYGGNRSWLPRAKSIHNARTPENFDSSPLGQALRGVLEASPLEWLVLEWDTCNHSGDRNPRICQVLHAE